MTNKKENEYGLLVFKTNGDVLDVLIDDSYDKVHGVWKELLNRWKICLEERKPFELLHPYVTAFDPGMITEIRIMPRVKSTQADNPYDKDMRKKGFANTFLENGNSILDQGYKF